MIKNVTLKYPNNKMVQVDKLCSYRIYSIQKEFLLYTLKEDVKEFGEVYFGELVIDGNILVMRKLQDMDIEAFTKFLISLSEANVNESESVLITDYLENQEILVESGGKTKVKQEIVNLYFTDVMEENEEDIEELILDEFEDLVKEEEIQQEEMIPVQEEVVPIKAHNPEEIIKELKQPSPKKKQKKTRSYFLFLAVLFFAVTLIGYMIVRSSQNGFEGNWNFLNNHSTITLEQIGQKLKTSSFLSDIIENHGDIFITTTSSEILIKIGENSNLEYRYVLRGDSIYTTISKEDEIGMHLAEYTYTHIQELLGNDRNEVFNRITAGFKNPSLQKEGISILEDGANYNIQISMKTKIDLTSIVIAGPIEKELFQSYQDSLLSKEQLTLQYGDISFMKSFVEDKIQVLLIEKKRLSKDLYQTLLNYLEAAYGEAKAMEFRSEYSNFSDEEKEFNNYKVTVNGMLDDTLSMKYPSREYEWVIVQISQ